MFEMLPYNSKEDVEMLCTICATVPVYNSIHILCYNVSLSIKQLYKNLLLQELNLGHNISVVLLSRLPFSLRIKNSNYR